MINALRFANGRLQMLTDERKDWQDVPSVDTADTFKVKVKLPTPWPPLDTLRFTPDALRNHAERLAAEKKALERELVVLRARCDHRTELLRRARMHLPASSVRADITQALRNE